MGAVRKKPKPVPASALHVQILLMCLAHEDLPKDFPGGILNTAHETSSSERDGGVKYTYLMFTLKGRDAYGVAYLTDFGETIPREDEDPGFPRYDCSVHWHERELELSDTSWDFILRENLEPGHSGLVCTSWEPYGAALRVVKDVPNMIVPW